MKSETLTRLISLTVITLLVSACASMQPISNYARTGDTVMISLGGTESNALVPVLKKENLTITITDSVSNSYPVKIRRVFRVYSDPTSGYSYRSASMMQPSAPNLDVYVDAHQGQWMAVIDLVDPATDTPWPLATGPAQLSVSSPEIQNWVDHSGYGWAWTNGNLDNIPVEILAGTGSSNPMNYLGPMSNDPMASLEPQPQVEVTVSGTPLADIGGGSLEILYTNADSGQNAAPSVTATTPDPNIQLASSREPQGDGTTLLRILITNPHGFMQTDHQAGLAAGKSMLRSLRFNLVWEPNAVVNDANWQNSIQLVNSEFVDVDGNTLPGLTPVLTKVR